MPFLLLITGIVLVVAGVKNNQSQLFQLLSKDFSGSGSFLSWALAIGIIGGLGYIEEIRPASRAMMALLIVVLFLSNKGFFAQFNQQINSSTTSTSRVLPQL